MLLFSKAGSCASLYLNFACRQFIIVKKAKKVETILTPLERTTKEVKIDILVREERVPPTVKFHHHYASC